MTPFGLLQGLDTSRHTLYQILIVLLGDLIPLCLHMLPQFQDTLGWLRILSQPLFDEIPEVFNGVHVR
jgi:hypothetical protein